MNIFETMINRIVILSLLMFMINANAFELVEDAMETESLRISMNDDGTGFVQGKLCDECKLLKVAITAGTKAFYRGKEVPIKQATSRLGRSATIFIDMKHTSVTRIVW